MKRILLLLVVLTTILFASCSEKHKSQEERKQDKIAMLDSIMQSDIDNRLDSIIDVMNESMDTPTVVSKKLLNSTEPIAWACDSIGQKSLKNNAEYEAAFQDVAYELLASEMGEYPSWKTSLKHFKKLDEIIKSAGVEDRVIYYRKYATYEIKAQGHSEVVTLYIDYDLPNKKVTSKGLCQ